MKFFVEQQFSLFVSNFIIYNENHVQVYKVNGKLRFLYRYAKIVDTNENPIGNYEGKLFGFSYTLNLPEGKKVRVRRELSLGGSKHYIEVNQGVTYLVQGSFMEHDYQIIRENKEIGRIKKGYFQILDKYEIEFNDEEEVLPILLGCVIVDSSKHRPKG